MRCYIAPEAWGTGPLVPGPEEAHHLLHVLRVEVGTMLEVFDGSDPGEYEAEAREHWGGTDAYQESARRTAAYTEEDWEQMGREADEINAAFLVLMEAGAPADSAEAMALAERHRSHISKWFYECTPEIHTGLGALYVADSRFTENIDKAGEGLARYLSDAIAANHSPAAGEV